MSYVFVFVFAPDFL